MFGTKHNQDETEASREKKDRADVFDSDSEPRAMIEGQLATALEGCSPGTACRCDNSSHLECVNGPDEPMKCARSEPRGFEPTREYQQHQSSGLEEVKLVGSEALSKRTVQKGGSEELTRGKETFLVDFPQPYQRRN